MTCLSRLRLDPRSASVRRDMRDVHDIHRSIMSAFGDTSETSARAALKVLFRLEFENEAVVLVQSDASPDWTKLPADYLLEDPELTSLEPLLRVINDDVSFRFRVLANVTKDIARQDDTGTRRSSERRPVYREDERLAWLIRKGEQHGFMLREVIQSEPIGTRVKGNANGQRRTFNGVRFDGVLQTTDPEALSTAVSQGIGRGKAYGFGMLSLIPMQSLT